MCKKNSILWVKMLVLLFCSISITKNFSQTSATIQGNITNEKSIGLAAVTISIHGKEIKTTSNDVGYFSISVPSNTPLALVFSYSGYKPFQKNLMYCLIQLIIFKYNSILKPMN